MEKRALEEVTVAKISIMPTKYVRNMDFFHPSKKKKKEFLVVHHNSNQRFLFIPHGLLGVLVDEGYHLDVDFYRTNRGNTGRGVKCIYLYIHLF